MTSWDRHQQLTRPNMTLQEMWLTPIKSIASPLAMRRSPFPRPRLQSDDIEAEGATPEVFCDHHFAIRITPDHEDDCCDDCVSTSSIPSGEQTDSPDNIENPSPTPPTSPELRCSRNRQSSQSSQSTSSVVLEPPPPASTALARNATAFPRPAGLLATIPTPPGSPSLSSVARSTDQTSDRQAMSPLLPRTGRHGRQQRLKTQKKRDPLSGWEYSNPKISQVPTSGSAALASGGSAFPSAALLPGPKKMESPNAPFKSRSGLSPEQRARAKLMLEGAVRWAPEPEDILSKVEVRSECASAEPPSSPYATVQDRPKTQDPVTNIFTSPIHAEPQTTSVLLKERSSSKKPHPLRHAMSFGLFDWDYKTSAHAKSAPPPPSVKPPSTSQHDTPSSVVNPKHLSDKHMVPLEPFLNDTKSEESSLLASEIEKSNLESAHKSTRKESQAVDEEYSWGCRVPDTTYYPTCSTSLGWDGCFYSHHEDRSKAPERAGVLYDLV